MAPVVQQFPQRWADEVSAASRFGARVVATERRNALRSKLRSTQRGENILTRAPLRGGYLAEDGVKSADA